ncbi:hypothetical protein HNY73_008165 [Argiope bruennichi]|uniref:Tantalus-like domain-containing protein n=1 Tax=Argiope bruennichi TaxID=94029 RepID=A0A8T0FAQ7_ARGBR|nr:hypothetical protein HNY73_008165 [Argiope bruennichi]
MTEKKPKKDKKLSVEELYQNKNFVPPKEKNLETIFEEPRKAKDGKPMFTSVRKYKRYLHFDSTDGKIQKRKMKAKKCVNKMKLNTLRTRSSTKTVRDEDMSLYILETIGDSSDSDMDVAHEEPESTSGSQNKRKPRSRKKVSPKKNQSMQTTKEVCDPMPNQDILQETTESQKTVGTISAPESEQSTKTENLPGFQQSTKAENLPGIQQSTKAENLPEDSKEDSHPENFGGNPEEPFAKITCL